MQPIEMKCSNSFLEIARAGNVGGRTHIVNVATIINRSVWICYGAMLKSVNYSIVLTNITGVAFHFGYLTVYVICCRGQRAFFFKWVAIGVAFAAGIAGACFYLHSAGSNLPDVFGSCGLVTGILMYLGGAVENMVCPAHVHLFDPIRTSNILGSYFPQ
jgi:hypothetical protein